MGENTGASLFAKYVDEIRKSAIFTRLLYVDEFEKYKINQVSPTP